MRESRKSKGASALCCGFLNESCIWRACGWEVEAGDEQREEGVASEETQLREAAVPGLQPCAAVCCSRTGTGLASQPSLA